MTKIYSASPKYDLANILIFLQSNNLIESNTKGNARHKLMDKLLKSGYFVTEQSCYDFIDTCLWIK